MNRLPCYWRMGLPWGLGAGCASSPAFSTAAGNAETKAARPGVGEHPFRRPGFFLVCDGRHAGGHCPLRQRLGILARNAFGRNLRVPQTPFLARRTRALGQSSGSVLNNPASPWQPFRFSCCPGFVAKDHCFSNTTTGTGHETIKCHADRSMVAKSWSVSRVRKRVVPHRALLSSQSHKRQTDRLSTSSIPCHCEFPK